MFEIITTDELLHRLDSYAHNELHVHHTWKPSHKDFNGSNGLQLQEGMKNYHVNTLKWQDIGQHVTLLPDGTFVTGRNFAITPASIAGHNTGGFACEMLGNFDIGQDKLEGKQKESIIKLAKYFDSKGRYIRFHRENASKTCPGSSIDKAEFMAEVRAIQEIERKVDNMSIKDVQKLCNKLGVTDYEDKALVEDGINGKRTESARIKLKEIFSYILK